MKIALALKGKKEDEVVELKRQMSEQLKEVDSKESDGQKREIKERFNRMAAAVKLDVSLFIQQCVGSNSNRDEKMFQSPPCKVLSIEIDEDGVRQPSAFDFEETKE